jgi:hypothetical protein
LTSSAASAAAAGEAALTSATQSGEAAAARGREGLSHRAGHHVCDDFGTFLHHTVKSLDQFRLLTICDTEAQPHALQLAARVQPELPG